MSNAGGQFEASAASEIARVRYALRRQFQVLSALFVREAGMRQGRAFGFSFLTSALEPLFIILTITFLFSVLDVSARFGPSLALFVGTGVFPIYVFIHTSMRIRQPLAPGLHRIRYPIEHPLDHVFVHALLHILTTTLTAFVFFGGLYWWGVKEAVPIDPMSVINATFALFVFGVAMGIINSVIARVLPIWDIIWPAFARASLHFSGPYFVVAYLPPATREIFGLNPIVHGVDWFRHGFYSFYPNQLSDHGYLMMFGLGGMAIALVSLAAMQNELRAKE